MATDSFGFDLLQKLHHDEIHKKEDVLVLFFHWYIIKNGCKCIGLGDSKDFSASEIGSELLPSKWNTNPSYALRYVKDNVLYVLLAIKSDQDLLLNFVNYNENRISNIMFPIEQTVLGLHGPLITIIPSYESILRDVQKDFLNILFLKSTKEANTQTIDSSRRNAREYLLITRHPENLRTRNEYVPNPERELGRVGARDLDPLAQGGGMILDPFINRQSRGPVIGIPGILPQMAVPPGARFNPFGPPDVDAIQRPNRHNNDHLPPEYNDMFM